MSIRRSVKILAAVAVLGIVGAACGDDDNSSSSDTTAADGATASAVPECLTNADLYALIGPESQGISNWSDANDLAKTVGGKGDFPDLPLQINGPGEESGTFDSFVELAIMDTAEAQGLADDEITTRPDYQSSPNDNVIVDGVASADGSLGWVGYAYYEENADKVRAIEVDGGDGCVAATNETIASGDYPLSRDLYIYVNTQKAKDNPAVAAWVNDYLSDEGRSQVSKVGYVDLTDADWQATLDAWEAAGIADPGDGQSGKVTVSGSSTVQPISSAVSTDVFKQANPDATFSVDGPGTGDGFQLFCNGETDISDASRQIKDEEAAVCKDKGIEFVELKVGIDGITVMTKK